MKPLPEILVALLEPAIYAVRQGSPAEVREVLGELDNARCSFASMGEAFHYPSYAAGAMASLREVLNTSLHRAGLNSVVDGVRAAQRGLDVLGAVGRAVVLGQKLSQKALAVQIGMNEGNFSRLSKRLIDLGALEVQREGSFSHLRTTPIGEAALDELLAGWRATTSIDDEDRPQIQLSDPFPQAKSAVRVRVFPGGASPAPSGAGAVTTKPHRLFQSFDQMETAATA